MTEDMTAGIILAALIGFFLYREFFRPMIKELIRKRSEKKMLMRLLEQRLDTLDAKQEVIRKALEASERITNEAMEELNRQKSAERNSMVTGNTKK